MSGWSVPLSSSPQIPSTPQSGKPNKSLFPKPLHGSAKTSFAPNPSTTPAGPPPSSVGSFTPAEPPPSSIFGSSQLGSGKTLFKSKSSSVANSGLRKGSNRVPSNSIDKDKLARFLDGSNRFELSNGGLAKNKFGMPSSSPPVGMSSDEEEGDYEDESEALEEDADAEVSEEEEEEQEAERTGRMAVEPAPWNDSLELGSFLSSTSNNTQANRNATMLRSSILDTTPRGIKRSHGGFKSSKFSQSSPKRSSKPDYESAIPRIVRSMASQLSVAKLQERDDFIVGTEDIITQELYGTEVLGDQHEQALKAGLPKASERLSNFWRSYCAQDLARFATRQEYVQGIGPDERAPSVHKATFLATLLLRLRHPPTAKGKQALAIARLNRSSIRSTLPDLDGIPSNPTAFPKILIDWLQTSHDPYEAFNADVHKFQPNPTAHFNYWDVIFSMTLRGRLADVIHLLKRSDYHHARTARDDRKDDDGYSEIQIRNIDRVINRAAQVLEHCPSIRDDNWNVTGNDWILFRKRVEQAIRDLATFAEGRDRDTDPAQSTLEASNFGLQSTTMGLSRSARKAESQVPWSIYQNIKAMYGILLGESTEILAMAQDWVEATIGLTVWWTGDDDEDVAVGSVAVARQSLRQSSSHVNRLVDINPSAAYLRRLAFALERVDVESSNEQGLAINTLSPVEVGLASVFEGDVAGVVGLLRAWSLPVASGVVEIASAGGWLDLQPSMGVMSGLDESDLILLNGRVPTEQFMTRDTSLVLYAEALSYRGKVHGSDQGNVCEGWELSICILTRLDDEMLAAGKVRDLLQGLPTDSDVRVDMILGTCKRFGITKEAREIAEKYANHIVETTDKYGTALIYFARAHCQRKVKDVLDLLISLSLVQSTAYPASTDLDPNLKALILEPRSSLGQLALKDKKAAEILHTYITGYATLRRFYYLRDEEVQLREGQKPQMRPMARRTVAATALVAVINSAADNIHGGLYDESRAAVVQVDALLTLLGEAMVFVNQSVFLLSLSQCFALLKAIEDLQTVAPRIYSQCEECFHSTLAACRKRSTPSSPRGLLKKTMSSMSGSFSIVGDSMINSESSGMGSSKALVKSQEVNSREEVKRGWDWRTGLDEKAKGEDVLRILRLGLAKDIAKHWMAGEES